jgi:hypothetical protein
VDGCVVLMTKRRPPGVQPDPRLVEEQLTAALPQSALDELRRQNQDLIAALDDTSKRCAPPRNPRTGSGPTSATSCAPR